MAVSGHNLNAVMSEYGTDRTGNPPHMNALGGTVYWHQGIGYGNSATFPSTNISLNSMYLTSPDNDWAPTDCGACTICVK